MQENHRRLLLVDDATESLRGVEKRQLVQQLLQKVGLRERVVLECRFGEAQLTLEETAKVLASVSGRIVTKERIRQIERDGLRTLRRRVRTLGETEE